VTSPAQEPGAALSDLKAGVLVVGNEILSAKVRDENGPFLLDQLHGLGVEVPRLLVVADRPEEIAWGIDALRGSVDWVLTSGGVGPTHDDVTVAGVAQALGRRIVRAPEIVALIEHHFGVAAEPAAYRLAEVPEGAELIWQPGVWIPLVVADRIALLPGVPELCRLQFGALVPRMRSRPFLLRQVFVSSGEASIAGALSAVASRHPAVDLGSYPRFDPQADHRVKLTIESRDASAVASALEDLLALLPRDCIVRQE
jgi:molybdenum cofactor synthesis domain-containing protein